MEHPDKGESVSKADSDDIADEPSDVTQLCVTDQENNAVGYLEKWDTDEWLYVDVQGARYLQYKRYDEYQDELNDTGDYYAGDS